MQRILELWIARPGFLVRQEDTVFASIPPWHLSYLHSGFVSVIELFSHTQFEHFQIYFAILVLLCGD